MANPAAQPFASPPSARAWSQVWQLPVLLAGAALFGAGLWLALPSGPSVDLPGALDQAALSLKANNLPAAQKKLASIGRYLKAHPDAAPDQKGRYLQYDADRRYLKGHRSGSVTAPGQSPAGDHAIAAQYARSRATGRSLDPRSVTRYARTLGALGRLKEALALVDALPAASAAGRGRILRALIEQRLAGAQEGEEGRASAHRDVLKLLERFKDGLQDEPASATRREQAAWAAGVEAKLQLEAGDPQRAIDFLLRSLQRFDDGGEGRRPGADTGRTKLLVLLAQAYERAGDADKARRLYRYAQQKLPEHHALHAVVLLGLGRLAASSGREADLHEALDDFRRVVRGYPSQRPYVEALIGKADCEARLASYPEAIKDLRRAVKHLTRAASPGDARRGLATDVARSQLNRAMNQKRYARALDFLTLLVPLAKAEERGEASASADSPTEKSAAGADDELGSQDKLPPWMLLDFAQLHEHIADQRKRHGDELRKKMRQGEEATAEAAPEIHPKRPTATPGAAARRLAYQQAALHYEDAGRYYLRHARAVSVTDDAAHGRSLWKAATCFNHAQAWKRAIDVYTRIVQTRRTDAHQLAAILQLGKAYMANRQYAPAVKKFSTLVGEHPNSPEALHALVPLARAYLRVKRGDAAERTLLKVVTDHPTITPASDQYRRALIELGKLYYRRGEKDGRSFVPAIERLEEAVKRYGRTEQGGVLRYLLADAYRRSVRPLDKKLAGFSAASGPQDKRLALQAERTRRFEQAQMYYDQAINQLESRPDASLTPLRKLYRRNAYFYRADCAYDRGRYQTAIQLYEDAARRWRNDPASLVALVQIVNADCELGKYQQAKAVNQRARWRLKQIPDKAFDDPTLPMNRKQWEDWLRWTHELDRFDTQQAKAR